MDQVVLWSELVALIEPHTPKAGPKGERPAFGTETMLRIHFLQQWFTLSDPAMEEELYDVPLYCQFAGLDVGMDALPDESTLLRFRHLLERHGLATRMFETVRSILLEHGLMLKAGTAVDATIIAAPSSAKNSTGTRDPEMHQTRKGNQWHFGMTSRRRRTPAGWSRAAGCGHERSEAVQVAHIGVDADSGLMYTLRTTPANAHDITEAHKLLHGDEEDVFADSGYRGVHKRQEVKDTHPDINWHVAMMPGKRKKLDESKEVDALVDELERTKARIRSKVEHPFRVIKRQFGHAKVRYQGLAKNTGQLLTLFMLANLWQVRKRILQAAMA